MRKVSILINNYNYGPYLGACIESCLAQDYENLEIVVVDDGSKDDSVSIAKSYEGVKVVAKENGGQASAFDTGVANSTGEVLCFLDSDDLYLPNKVSAMVGAFDWSAGPMIAYHRLLNVDQDGNPRPIGLPKRAFGALRNVAFSLQGQKRRLSTPKQVLRDIERYGVSYRPWPRQTSCIAINRAMAEKIFPLGAEGVRAFADAILLRCATLHGPCFELFRELVKYRIHPHSITHTERKKDNTEESVIRIVNEHLERMGRRRSATMNALWFDSELVTEGKVGEFLAIAKAKHVSMSYALRLVAFKTSKRLLSKVLRAEHGVHS